MKIEQMGTRTQPLIKMNRSVLADLICICFLGLSLLILIVLGHLNPAGYDFLVFLRLPLSLVYLLFIPGYLLQSTLFPRRNDLETVERIGASIGLSLGLIPLIALLLNSLPWGLRLWPVVISQSILVVFLLFTSAIRRSSLRSDEVYTPAINVHPGFWWRNFPTGDRPMVILAGIILVSLSLASAYIFLVPSDAEFMTEFYMLGPEGLAENFPREANVGQSLDLTTAVTNHERGALTYHLEVYQVDSLDETRRQLVGQAPPFALPVGDTKQWQQSFHPAWAGQDQKFEFLLYIDGQQDPYRQLSIYIDVDR